MILLTIYYYGLFSRKSQVSTLDANFSAIITNMENAIQIKDLRKSFKNVDVLKGINLQVKKGTMLALLGPNGAGKTTTVRILSTLLQPDSGTVTVNGFDAATSADDIRSTIGLTGQYAAVDDLLTGRENIEMFGRLYHLSKEDSRKRAQELLEQFDLVDAADRAAKTYSGGMRRRLDLAASLVATPPIVFLDEPTTGLDPRSRLAMWDVIQKLKASGTTILLTTQYLEEADKLADRVAVIDNGTVIAEGTANELKATIGQERLEIIIHEDSNFQAAADAITGDNEIDDESTRTISISTDNNVEDTKRVLNQMQEANIKLESLSLHKPTLDDVFLHLTGHTASDDKTDETASTNSEGATNV